MLGSLWIGSYILGNNNFNDWFMFPTLMTAMFFGASGIPIFVVFVTEIFKEK